MGCNIEAGAYTSSPNTSFFVEINSHNISYVYKKIKEFESNQMIKKEILKILFYIYYYEEHLLNSNLDNIFNDYQNLNYSLINSIWIQKFKEFYGYKRIYDYLKDYNSHNKFPNYNSDGNITIILNSYLDKYANSINSEFPESLVNTQEIKTCLIRYEGLSFYGNNYIISEKIFEMIKKNVFNDKLSYKPNKIFSKKNNIFLVDNCKLIIGNLNEELIFIPKYILNYNIYQF